ncbi:polyketide hydroxylase [Streptomyces sp. NPDC050674]|uniref:aromatic-ring hydroxylase C-terminal domain-containing protein n=1 Tax=Streptomyces sp. NPDC050674 TaxID=3157216 RepID=UPI00342B27FB
MKTGDGGRRVFELLHTARPVLLDLRGDTALAATAESWAGRVDLVEARSAADHWPVWPVDETPAPAALLIRPDGHVAWTAHAGTTPDLGALRTALTAWFGPAMAD